MSDSASVIIMVTSLTRVGAKLLGAYLDYSSHKLEVSPVFAVLFGDGPTFVLV